mmetsp:Transcript_12707/g.41904  ORF Transcript_12707/g.41904 Transcript_12707/m.41904 type:complete len:107 (+) Transcript_12707:811-1131(+)
MPPFPEQFTYKVIDIWDSPNAPLIDYFPEVVSFIDDAVQRGGSVLVHCFAGRSRSTTAVLAYLVARRGWDLGEALVHVKARRDTAQPNEGFMKQLQAFECTLASSR